MSLNDKHFENCHALLFYQLYRNFEQNDTAPVYYSWEYPVF